MKTVVLSSENIYSYRTRQEGYGRQGLYLSLTNLDGAPNQEIYWGSVFPNPEEEWDLHTYDEVFPKMDEEDEIIEGAYTDGSGNEVDEDRIFDSIFDGVVAMISGDEVEVEEEDEE